MKNTIVCCVYKDTIPNRYSEEELSEDNLCSVSVPEMWFVKKLEEHDMTMEYFQNESIADDFEWLYKEALMDGIDIKIID